VWDCDVAIAPNNCSTGALYMKLRSALESCQMDAFLSISKKKLAYANNMTNAGDVRAACQKSIACETDTVAQWLTPASKNATCYAFFGSPDIVANFPWAASCNQAQVCKDYAATVAGTPGTSSLGSRRAPAPLRGALYAAAAATAAVAAALAAVA
jgi:hypothetical protein